MMQVQFFKGVLGNWFGSVELNIGSLESEKIIKENILTITQSTLWNSKNGYFVTHNTKDTLSASVNLWSWHARSISYKHVDDFREYLCRIHILRPDSPIKWQSNQIIIIMA